MKLYGKNPVIERLKNDPRSISKIYLQQGHGDAGYIRKKAQKWGIAVLNVPASKIQKMARNVNTQGVLADIGEFLYMDYDELLERALKKGRSPLFLDGLNDPQNLGVIIRSLACLGYFDIVLPTHKSVKVTETVLRIACGGENSVGVSQVKNIRNAILRAREKGFWIVGTVVGKAEDVRMTDFQFPLGLVVGSEHKGIRPVVIKELDAKITLPMAQQGLSMNAAQAVTLFCYEINRNRK